MSSGEYGTGKVKSFDASGFKIVEDTLKEYLKFQMIVGISLEDFNKLYLAGIVNVEPVNKEISIEKIIKISKNNSIDQLIKFKGDL
jgi:hypothetical protein